MLLVCVEDGDESREESGADDASSLTVGHGSTVQLLDIHVDTPSRGSIHRFRENQTTKTTANSAIPFQSMVLASERLKRTKWPCVISGSFHSLGAASRTGGGGA